MLMAAGTDAPTMFGAEVRAVEPRPSILDDGAAINVPEVLARGR